MRTDKNLFMNLKQAQLRPPPTASSTTITLMTSRIYLIQINEVLQSYKGAFMLRANLLWSFYRPAW